MKALHKIIIKASIITGSAREDIVIIPRIAIIPTHYPFEFIRLQFPLKAYFTMKVNVLRTIVEHGWY